jgi:hypothetical protein
MSDPLAVDLLCHAQFALVEIFDDGVDGFFELCFHVAWGDVGTAFKSFFDDGLQLRHGSS